MTTLERALKIIERIDDWNPLHDNAFRIAGPTAKCKMIANWGLNGDEQMLYQTEKELQVFV